jgi:hypothetical protein
MAVDEAILEAYAGTAHKPDPTLRLYGWKPATLSLGRSQRAEEAHDARVLAAEGIGLVRRPTGGVAVLHEFERTYAVVGALGAQPFSGGAIATYRAIAEALRRGLTRLGVAATPVEPRRGGCGTADACVERVGAGARRERSQALGSAKHAAAGFLNTARSVAPVSRGWQASRDAGRLSDSRPGNRAWQRRRSAEVDRARRRLRGDVRRAVRPRNAHRGEALRAAELRCWKYDSIAWTYGGKLGDREVRWGPAVSR